jgi:hypothetical protein
MRPSASVGVNKVIVARPIDHSDESGSTPPRMAFENVVEVERALAVMFEASDTSSLRPHRLVA